ncbi:hypothetical protein V2J09_007716 [Rumex salicifolius]
MAVSRAVQFSSSLLRFQFGAPFSSSSLSVYHFSLSRRQLIASSYSTVSASLSTQNSNSSVEESQPLKKVNRWRPMCLYYTQGKCTMMDDHLHMEKFNHNCCGELQADTEETKNFRAQPIDYLLVLDLEGKVEILEFPVLMIDAKTLQIMDFFHRFVRPTKMSEQRIDEYIEGKYGKIGIDSVWHDTAIPFKEVIEEFEAWMTQHNLWAREFDGPLKKAAFVTCGNWDIKTKIPQQCVVAGMKLPPYFMEWINLKDVYLNFYNKRATGMMTMLKQLNIQQMGSHHLGIDDSKNIARVVQRMLADGALMDITAMRDSKNPERVRFLFENRIIVRNNEERVSIQMPVLDANLMVLKDDLNSHSMLSTDHNWTELDVLQGVNARWRRVTDRVVLKNLVSNTIPLSQLERGVGIHVRAAIDGIPKLPISIANCVSKLNGTFNLKLTILIGSLRVWPSCIGG